VTCEKVRHSAVSLRHARFDRAQRRLRQGSGCALSPSTWLRTGLPKWQAHGLNIRRGPLISPLPTAGEGVGEGAFRTNPSCACRAPHASSGGLLHYPEQWDEVGADGEEKDVQAGEDQ